MPYSPRVNPEIGILSVLSIVVVEIGKWRLNRQPISILGQEEVGGVATEAKKEQNLRIMMETEHGQPHLKCSLLISGSNPPCFFHQLEYQCECYR